MEAELFWAGNTVL